MCKLFAPRHQEHSKVFLGIQCANGTHVSKHTNSPPTGFRVQATRGPVFDTLAVSTRSTCTPSAFPRWWVEEFESSKLRFHLWWRATWDGWRQST
eukprot:2438556-Amphidinium_carterae.1